MHLRISALKKMKNKFNKKLIGILILAVLFLNVTVIIASAARYQTTNFDVETADPALAQQFGNALEASRKSIAIELYGQAFPTWSNFCPVTIHAAPGLGAGGATTFVFSGGQVFGWRMTIQGSAQRLIDSVIPHEVCHMILATIFRQPIPRWADEGFSTTYEACSEKEKHKSMLIQFLKTGRGIAFDRLFAITEYPRDIMPMYAEGYSLAEFLSLQGGKKKFVTQFLSDIVKNRMSSEAAVKKHYGYADLTELQNTWLAWVRQGSPQTGIPGCKDPNVNENIQLKALKTVPSSYAAN